jgi:uncharacterized membrane protein
MILMDWIFFALLSPIFFALNDAFIKTFIDKDKRFDKPFPYSILLTFVDVVFIASVFFLFPISTSYPSVLVTFVYGALVSYIFYFFYNAMKHDEGSRSSALMQTNPLLTALLSAALIGEVLSPSQYAGIILIVSAAILISHKWTEGGRKRSPALKYALIFAVFVAIANVFTKFMLGSMDFWSLFFWTSLGVLANNTMLLLIPSIRRDFGKLARLLDRRTVFFCFVKESLWFLGDLAFLFATTYGPVSIVAALGALQPLFYLFIAILSSALVPHILKEDLGRRHLLEKALAVVMIFLGIWLLNVI